MAGFIIWIVVIIWIICVSAGKSRQRGSNCPARPAGKASAVPNRPARPAGKASAVPNRPAKPVGNGKDYNPWQGFDQAGNAMKQQATKERLQKKYGRPVSSDGDILERAKASVAEDFDKDELEVSGEKNPDTKAAESSGKNAGNDMEAAAIMVQDARKRQQEMERRIAEKLASAEAEQSDIMKTVEDLIVKGPDTGIAFERDFVSEGLALLNRIQS